MHLLIPSAGLGSRMGADHNKLLLTLQGKPLLAWTLLAAESATEISWIGIIGQPYDWDSFQEILTALAMSKPVVLIPGGATRQESVYKGLQQLPENATQVLIHDGARCLATPELLDRCAVALAACPGLIAAVPVKDTIKIVDDHGRVKNTPDRRYLWAAQTPQGFEVELLRKCHAKGEAHGWLVTDDAALFEKCGLAVQIVRGEETNLKVTTPEDMAIAESILRDRQKIINT